MPFLAFVAWTLAAAGASAVPSGPRPGTLVVGILEIASSYARDVEQPAGPVHDTVQFWFGADRAWRVRTFATDHDIHVHDLGRPQKIKGTPVGFARGLINRIYGDVLVSIVVLDFPDANERAAAQRVLASQKLGGLVEVAAAGFAFWNPDEGVYRTKSKPK